MSSIRHSNVNWFSFTWKSASLFLALFSTLSARALTFNVTYDSSVTSLTNAAQVEAAFSVATQTFQSLYTNNMTVNLTVYFSSTVDLGESYYPLEGNPTYDQLTNALRAARTTVADSNSVASLPASNPIGSSVWWIPPAEAKALTTLPPPYNVSPTDSSSDGSVYFASTVNYTFDATNRSVAGKFDFIGIAEHEISEVLGRSYSMNYNGGGYVPYDLFRFTNSGARSLNVNDANVYFSTDNGKTALKYFFGDVNSGDVQDWETYSPADAFDAFLSAGEEARLSAADLAALDILGYNLSFAPPRVTGTRTGNGSFQLNFTSITGLNFSVLVSSDPTLPLANWTVLGSAIELASGQYQFTDTASNVRRYYRVRLN